MGSRSVSARPFIHNVIFAAPDVYVARFGQLADTLEKSADRVTLYASSADQALYCSQLFHEGPRAGQTGENLVLHPRIETIDVTNSETRTFMDKIVSIAPTANLVHWLVSESCRKGHSYVTRNISVINDLHSLVTFDASPDDRILLERRESKGHRYWDMRRATQ